MALRTPRRLLTAALAGGLVTGSLLLGAGTAVAAPSDDDVVEARCGQTVRAEPGQTVKVIPELGLPFEREVRRGMQPIREIVGGLGGLLCRVQVQVVEPVAEGVAEAAPPLRPAAEELRRGTGAVLDPTAQPRTETSRSRTAPTTARAAEAPTFTPQQAAAAAPAFAPAFGTLPSSFLRSATAPATGPAPGLATYDPNMLLGSAFPGLRAGAPAYLGYDPASAVTTASQVQALPVDALTDGGVGVPALLAVLALSGVAAFTVRRIVLGKAPTAGATPAADEAAEPDEAASDGHAADDEYAPADAAADADADEDEDAAEDATTAAPRTPVPA